MRRSPVPVAVITLAVLLVALLTYGLLTGGTSTNLDTRVQRGEKPPAPAANVELPRLGGGGTTSLADLRGKVVVVNVWASWCPPCEDEAPILTAVSRALAKAGDGQVLGVTHVDPSEKSLAKVREWGLPYPSVRDVDDELYKAFGATRAPRDVRARCAGTRRSPRARRDHRGLREPRARCGWHHGADRPDTEAAVGVVTVRSVLRRALALLAALIAVGGGLAPVALGAVSQTDIEDEVMCVQCGRPLATSSGTAADDERQLIQGWIDQGLTKAQIKDRLVSEYGQRVLVHDRSPVAAAAPWLAALAGIASITLLLRRRGQRGEPAGAGAGDTAAASGPEPSAGGASVPALSAEDDARIDAELAERD